MNFAFLTHRLSMLYYYFTLDVYIILIFCMAHKKAAGSTSLGRDSQPQYLGVKLADGETAYTGNIIVRQRGTKVRVGKNVKKGSDDTLFAMIDGIVRFTKKRVRMFDGNIKMKTFVRIDEIAK